MDDPLVDEERVVVEARLLDEEADAGLDDLEGELDVGRERVGDERCGIPVVLAGALREVQSHQGV